MTRNIFKAVLLASVGLAAYPADAQEQAAGAGAQTTASAPQAGSDGSSAQPNAPEGEDAVGEIVVTAQRRTESVQDVPIAISVVSGAQLERQQVVELRDLSRSTAGLEFGANSGANPGGGASIRGLGTTAFSRAAEAAVGVVVDGVVQGNANVNNLFDVSRVEVLRGPQGTLFGQSTSAGVINITTVAPNPSRAEGKFLVELSDDGFAGSKFGRQVLRAAANAPVTDTSALRVSLYSGRTAGVTRNVFLNRNDEQYEFGARARYLAELGPVTLNLIGDYSDSKLTDGGFFVFGGAGPNAARFNAQCGVRPSLSNFEHCSDYPSVFQTKTYGLSGQADVDLGGGFTLTSITAARHQTFDQRNDIDRLPQNLTTLNISSASKTRVGQFTQEVRLASDANQPLSFTVGGYYQRSITNDDTPGDTGVDLFFARAGLPGPPTLSVRTAQFVDTTLKNLSGFGEARYHTGALTVFGGARVNRNTIDADALRQQLLPARTPVQTVDLSFKDTDVSWRGGAQYEFSRAVMLYATASRGYKSGQVAANINPAVIVRPEKPMDYQVGLKTELFDRRLAVNLNGFYTRVKDYQATVTSIDASTGVVTGAPFNIDKVVTKGAEIELFGRLGRYLTLNGSALYNIARYPTGFRAQNGGLIEDEQIAFAPRFKATLSGEYRRPITDSINGFLAVDGAYKSRTRYGIESDSDTYNFYKRHLIVGARVGVDIDERWNLALFARNIGNVASPFSIGQIPQPLGDAPLSSRHVYQSSAGLRQVGLQLGLTM